MEQKGHVASLLALVAVAIAGLACLVIVVKSGSVNVGERLQGYTPFTVNPSNQVYTDSADLYQNVQAMAERMASGSQYALLQADSAGNMQRVAPSALAGSWTIPVLTVSGTTTLTGVTSYLETSVNTSAGTTTLTSADSGKTYYISGATTTILLPATSTAIIGANYRFVVGGALSVSTSIKTATGADEIEGTLIVAGAVVDCDAEDEIVLGASVENIGDYVEFRWSGTYWMLGDSGALTATAIACTKT